MEIPFYMFPLAVTGGALAGVINTLAGSGSLVTLPILVSLGLPADMANATNRVGVLSQCITGLITYHRAGKLHLSGTLRLILPSFFGASFGAYYATNLNAESMHFVIGIVLIVMLGLILLNPKRLLRETSEEEESGQPRWWLSVLFFLVGLYGGFLQAGVGVVMLVSLVLGGGFSIVHANGIKLMITLCFNIAAMAFFLSRGLVHWPLGLLVAVGQGAGAWLAVRFLVDVESAPVWTRRLLIVVVVLGIGKFWLFP